MQSWLIHSGDYKGLSLTCYSKWYNPISKIPQKYQKNFRFVKTCRLHKHHKNSMVHRETNNAMLKLSAIKVQECLTYILKVKLECVGIECKIEKHLAHFFR